MAISPSPIVRCGRSTFPFKCGEYGAVVSAAQHSSPAARLTACARNSLPPSNRISCGTPPHGPRSGSITIPSRIVTKTSALVGYSDTAHPITSREHPSSITVNHGRTSRRPCKGTTLISSSS
jgi:hypothetical protein